MKRWESSGGRDEKRFEIDNIDEKSGERNSDTIWGGGPCLIFYVFDWMREDIEVEEEKVGRESANQPEMQLW